MTVKWTPVVDNETDISAELFNTYCGDVDNDRQDFSKHIANTNNPHNVTKAQLELDKVDNTPDAEKSVAYASDAGWADSTFTAEDAVNADYALSDFDGNIIVDTYATKEELSTALGDISTALDSIIALQNSYIGGTSE